MIDLPVDLTICGLQSTMHIVISVFNAKLVYFFIQVKGLVECLLHTANCSVFKQVVTSSSAKNLSMYHSEFISVCVLNVKYSGDCRG